MLTLSHSQCIRLHQVPISLPLCVWLTSACTPSTQVCTDQGTALSCNSEELAHIKLTGAPAQLACNIAL
eukprot:1138933-Pelagomonas_calceolata.AAC.3